MTSSTAPRPAPTVYSTGQTPEDIAGLVDLAVLSGAPLNKLALPPVLSDPNYIPSRYNQDLLNGFAAATAIIATAMVSIRMCIRTKQCRGRYSMDDYCLAIGYLMMVAQWTIVFVGVNRFQWGYHTYDMKLYSLIIDYKFLYVYEMLFTSTLVMVRLSLLFFLGRLFREASRSFVYLNNTLIVCNVVFGIASVFAYTFQCRDVRAAWDIYVKFKTGCKPLYIYYVISAFQLALDFASVLVPVKLVRALNGLTFKKKVEVLAMFSLGLSACVISVARCVYLGPIVEQLDQSNASVNLTICCLLEGTVAIVAACVPAARQFFGGLSNEPKVARMTGKVVSSLRSMTNSVSSTSKHSSVMISGGSQVRSQTGRGGGFGERDSRLLQEHYGRILGAEEEMEMVRNPVEWRGALNKEIDVEAAAGRAGSGSEKNDERMEWKTHKPWGRHLSISRLKFNHQTSRFSPTSSPSSPDMDFRACTLGATSLPSRPMPMVQTQESRPGLPTSAPSFESGGSGVNSSTNSLDLSHWDTLDGDNEHHPAALTPRPSSSGRMGQVDWRESVRVD
ncbi:hypothetical protein TWF106_009001 [Orbilia oligospora]|uniref:Rhodopsin domain-containing protein n=1 Tax=Orbilia oligospora TaxID=2813651 RepID=A0A6G1MEJ1_ORBOL|nr:hypothetical protein TWF788_003190 [Orbilia oligospora]KAF3204550.1 hypothetical protein TWF191_002244 [Orbilia oligospora]KAF3214644.1 hypothetical protein TWF106_009001 [Orbilia oligospora]KAF3222338.1 hypothetical protein TWF679_005819 [Orbilia oligospora]KAF3253456.1 hypothetical protein TWF192_003710 [Orbilia oligospora]